jgi:wyosine [tRNA(Phe)-imidazoG37] synthetase (radical SAM superfamily)
MARAKASASVRLSTTDHDRDRAGATYVYAVVSRRAGGVSIGVNLNPNGACNWRCVYCQVPGLVRGSAPRIDLERLRSELASLLASAQDERWLARHVPEGARQLRDVAISGNGEPTSSRQLPAVIGVIEEVLRERALLGRIPVVLITNGSLVHLDHAARALAHLARIGGEAWFKVDSATRAGQERLNDSSLGPRRTLEHLVACAKLCPTWVQTIALDFDGPTLAGEEERAYCELLVRARERGAALRGVRLYGLARASHQPEAPRLKALGPGELDALGRRIASCTGLEVRVTA